MVKTELNNTLTNDEMEKTINSYQTMMKLEKDIDRCKETIELIQEAATVEISKDPENEERIMIIYQPRVDHFVGKIKEKVIKHTAKMKLN